MAGCFISIVLVVFPAAPQPPMPETGRPLQAVGVGRPPPHMTGVRARLMARRAAEVVAVRELSRRWAASDGAPRCGECLARRRTRVCGFRYVSARELADGRVVVTVETVEPAAGRPAPHRSVQSGSARPPSGSAPNVRSQRSASSGETVSGFSGGSGGGGAGLSGRAVSSEAKSSERMH